MKVSITYNKLRLVNLLGTGEYRSVLFKFYHGLGDAISFYCNVLPVLRARYPWVKFYFDTERGQEEMFGTVSQNEEDYDLSVFVQFPCSEWEHDTDETKAEKCLRVEMGIEDEKQCDVYEMPHHYHSPLVGVHFHSTSSESLSVDYDTAHTVWFEIMNAGLIPIDTHFSHPGATLRPERFDFCTRNVADCNANMRSLFGLLGTLRGFIGVASGNFWAALTCLPPERIMYLETDFPVTKLTRLPVYSMRGFQPDVFAEFIRKLGETK